MEQRDLVVGFSELKDLLIRTYQIDRDRNLVRLYFTSNGKELFMHDFDDHQKIIILSFRTKEKLVRPGLREFIRRTVLMALAQTDPAEFLNINFQLHGFFKL